MEITEPLGSKSAFSYTDVFYYICRKDGIERKFIIHKAIMGMDINKIHEVPTGERNGVKVIIPINSLNRYEDERSFENAIMRQLCYFEGVWFKVRQKPNLNNFKIYKSHLFKYSTLGIRQDTHICIGNVNYPINWETLGISTLNNVPLGLNFGLDDGIFPTPNREGYISNDETNEKIITRIKEISTFFVEEYNKKVENVTNLIDGYYLIGSNMRGVVWENITISLESLEKHSSTPIQEVMLEGCKYRPASFYKNKSYDLLGEYSLLAEYNGDRFRADDKFRRINSVGGKVFHDNEDTKIILVDEVPVGHLREYMKEKYGCAVYIKKTKTMTLRPDKHSLYSPNYISCAHLQGVKRSEWRDRIKELQMIRDGVTSTFIDCRGIQIPQDWLAARKEWLKNNKIHTTGGYVGLGKKNDEFTISFGREYLRHGGNNKIVWEKRVMKISDNPHGTIVYFSDKDRETANQLWKLIPRSNLTLGVSVAIVGDREKNKIQSNNIKTFKQFMETKPFARLVTSLAIQRMLNNLPKRGIEIITEAFPKYIPIISKLKEYVKENSFIINEEDSKDFTDILLSQARDTNTWDWAIYNDYTDLEKTIDRIGYLDCIKGDDYLTDGKIVKRRKTALYKLMLFDKLHGDMFDDFELVRKVEEVPPVLDIKDEENNEEDLGEFGEVTNLEDKVEELQETIAENILTREFLEEDSTPIFTD